MGKLSFTNQSRRQMSIERGNDDDDDGDDYDDDGDDDDDGENHDDEDNYYVFNDVKHQQKTTLKGLCGPNQN